MVTNFETITHELNKYELEEVLPIVVDCFQRKKFEVENAVFMHQIMKGVNQVLEERFNKKPVQLTKSKKLVKFKKFGEPRMRKIIHYIRVNGLVKNLIATSKGYYKTNNIQEMKDFIKSCEERSSSFLEVSVAMENQLYNLSVELKEETEKDGKES